MDRQKMVRIKFYKYLGKEFPKYLTSIPKNSNTTILLTFLLTDPPAHMLLESFFQSIDRF